MLKTTVSTGLAAILPVCGFRNSRAAPATQARELPRRRPVQTVRGLIRADDLGPTLVHEHVMCDFVGAATTGRHRYKRAEVVEVMKPYLEALPPLGVKTFVDCTPRFIGRDPVVLARLSEAVGLHIITNTGLYKAPFLPPYALEESADGLAERWIKEFEEGIEDTGIRPGFIKIAVNPGPLLPIQQKIVRAACRTWRSTGMVIACHAGHGRAALEAIAIVRQESVPTDNFIFVHADSEPDAASHRAAADRGAWVEFDAIRAQSSDQSIRRIRNLLDQGFIDRVLLSQDSGWYNVGEPQGGKINGYTYLFEKFLRLLRESGISQRDVDRLVIENPARALCLDEPRSTSQAGAEG
jgi:phosphotriesterase-related protein